MLILSTSDKQLDQFKSNENRFNIQILNLLFNSNKLEQNKISYYIY